MRLRSPQSGVYDTGETFLWTGNKFYGAVFSVSE